MRSSIVAAALLGVLLLTAPSPVLRADVWDKKTVVNFPEAVEVPGAVLEPGTYVLKLVDSPSNRNIVRISSEDERRVHSTILAIPKYRDRPADRTILTFDERPAGQPQALRTWFYPGDTTGQEFTYPEGRAVEIAQAVRRPATESPLPERRSVEAPTATAPEEGARKPSDAETADPGPLAAAQAPPPPSPPVTEQEKPAAREKAAPERQAPAGTAPAEMPQTAGELPLVALLGLLSAAAALVIRSFRARRV
jgi:hypothetical protein